MSYPEYHENLRSLVGLQSVRRILPVLLSVLLFIGKAQAQIPSTVNGPKQPRILLLLDGSSSMLQPWGSSAQDQNRFQAAARLIDQLIDSIYAVNGAVEFSLRVYGQRYPAQENNCFDTEQEVMFSKDNRDQIAARLASLRPRGVSPIAYSLQQAATYDLISPDRNAYSIILVTDGGESCNGNICEVVEKLIQAKIHFKPYIVSLVDYEPLRQQYACLGSYLKVGDESAVGPAIHAIVEDYRPMLTSPKVVVAPPTVTAPAPRQPEPVVITTPKPQPPPPARRDTVVTTPPPARRDTVAVTPKPAPLPVVRATDTVVHMGRQPAAPKPEAVRGIRLSASTAPRIGILQVMRPSLQRELLPKVKFTEEPVAAKPRRPDSTVVTITRLPQTPPAAKLNKPAPAVPPATAEPATVDRSPAQETTAAVYFTDGRGKFYRSTPQLQFINKTTGAVVADFIRTVNDEGEPDFHKVPAGQYKLVIKGKGRDEVREVEVTAQMANRITIKVSNGTLRFAYAGAPNRPVKEYVATVNRRFVPGPVIRQACTVELPYEAGNYFIEINTVPLTRRNTDIDFFAVTEIQIAEPGMLKLTNTDPLGEVAIFAPLGDSWRQCATINVTGNVDAQTLDILPGVYEAHWKRGPEKKVQRFEIRSNFLTQAELE